MSYLECRSPESLSTTASNVTRCRGYSSLSATQSEIPILREQRCALVLRFINTVTYFAALPPDVRKVSDFPRRLSFMSGLRPEELGVAQILEIG